MAGPQDLRGHPVSQSALERCMPILNPLSHINVFSVTKYKSESKVKPLK